MRNWGGLDFDNVKTGTDLEKEWRVSNFFFLITYLLCSVIQFFMFFMVFHVIYQFVSLVI